MLGHPDTRPPHRQNMAHTLKPSVSLCSREREPSTTGRRHVVVGRKAHAEILRGEIGGRNSRTQRKAAPVAQRAHIRPARLVDLAAALQARPDEPPWRERVGDIRSDIDRRRLQIVALRDAIDRHAQVRDRQPASDTPIGRSEPRPLDPDRGTREELRPHPRRRRITSRHDGHAEVEAEKRRPAVTVVNHHRLRDVQPPLLENQVGEEIAQLRGENADAGAHHDVAHPVPVVQLPRHARHGGQRIAADTVPRTAVAVLLVQHRRGHEGRGRMPRGERVAGRSVGTHHPAGILERIDRNGHQPHRKGVRREHPSPRAAAPDSGGLHADHHRRRGVLQVVVEIVVERRRIPVAQPPEIGVIGLHDDATHHQRHADIQHPVGLRRSVQVDPPRQDALARRHAPHLREAVGRRRGRCEGGGRRKRQQTDQQKPPHLPMRFSGGAARAPLHRLRPAAT